MIIFADLHVHVGYANGRYIKIPSSKNMTLKNILNVGKYEKGLNVIALVDFLSEDVLLEFNKLVEDGTICASGNSFYYKDMLIILSAEIELRFNSKGFHLLLYFDSYQKIMDFLNLSKNYFSKNIRSCPVFKGDVAKLEQIIEKIQPLIIPAHVFTPYKGFYSCAKRIKDVFKNADVYAVELGLSADTYMVRDLKDISNMTFLSNSDAHSVQNIAREFNLIEVIELKTDDVIEAMINNNIRSNYGINPRLGKYHKTFCKRCKREFNIKDFSVNCPYCSSEDLVIGVEDRINMLEKINTRTKRPPYFYTFPFELIDGFGKKTREKILDYFGNEINFIRCINSELDYSELLNILGKNTVKKIERFKKEQYNVQFGAGGYFGRIKFE